MENPYTSLQKAFEQRFPRNGAGNMNMPASPLTKEQAKTLLQATTNRIALHALLSLALHLGISMEEALAIERKDIDFQNEILHLKTPIRDLKLTDEPLSALATLVRSIRQNNGEIRFIFPFGNRAVEKAVSDLGIANLGFPISWSSLRRTWAVMCFQRGVRIESMVRYSASSIDALSKWAVFGKAGSELPVAFFSDKLDKDKA